MKTQKQNFQMEFPDKNCIGEFENRSKVLDSGIPEWIDGAELCRLYKISSKTLRRYWESGKFPNSKMGGRTYYRPADVIGYLNANIVWKGAKP